MTDVDSGAYTGASPAIAGGRAFYGTFENEVLAVDLRAGRVAWSYKPADRQFPFYSSAAVADGKVVLGGRDKRVHALDAASGKVGLDVRRRRAASSPRPRSSAGRVYIGSNDGRLYVLDLATGRKLTEWHGGRGPQRIPGDRRRADSSSAPTTAASTAWASRFGSVPVDRQSARGRFRSPAPVRPFARSPVHPAPSRVARSSRSRAARSTPSRVSAFARPPRSRRTGLWRVDSVRTE